MTATITDPSTTMTTTIPDGVDLPAPPEQAKFTNEQLVRLIRRDGSVDGKAVSRKKAVRLIAVLEKSVEAIRARGHYVIPDGDMDVMHSVLETVVPDDVKVAAPGSAHAELSRRFLRPDETFLHTWAENRDSTARWCAVALVTSAS